MNLSELIKKKIFEQQMQEQMQTFDHMVCTIALSHAENSKELIEKAVSIVKARNAEQLADAPDVMKEMYIEMLDRLEEIMKEHCQDENIKKGDFAKANRAMAES